VLPNGRLPVSGRPAIEKYTAVTVAHSPLKGQIRVGPEEVPKLLHLKENLGSKRALERDIGGDSTF